ncbi:MAG TPA: hypothetical protein VJ974_04150 [Geopsychrobacteraceae bacterium]|nr:hypothetical protein [Geopsychrobacteraceae bacterium]
MKRFRVTLLVVCLMLGWLGFNDLSLYFRNRTPQTLSIEEITNQGAPREWVNIVGGQQDLLQAINMSGTMEIDSFLVPLKQTAETKDLLVWFETRDPQIISALKTYYFKLDTEAERAAFVDEKRQLFFARRDLTGMTVSNLVADSNRSKLKELLSDMNIPVSDQVVFISEGKKPSSGRGFFFMSIAFIGLMKLARDLSQKPAEAITDEE